MSKWGFMDGDILDDILWELYEGRLPEKYVFEGRRGSDCDHGFSHALLIETVKRKLLPVMPEGFKIKHFSSLHNPVRAHEDCEDIEVGDIYVIVQPDDVAQIAEQMVMEYFNGPA